MFNEELHVAATLGGIPEWVDGVVLVNDGSTDGSEEAVAAHDDGRVECVAHRARLGVGAALLTGFRRVLETPAEIVVTMDSDGQMAVDDLQAVIRPVVRDDADYAKGTRFHAQADLRSMPVTRRVGNRLISRYLARLVGDTRLRDVHCGYTAMTRSVVELLAMGELHPSYGVYNDILARICEDGRFEVEYVPVRTLYAEERSHLRWRDLIGLLRLTLEIRRRALPRPTPFVRGEPPPPSESGRDRSFATRSA